MTQDTFKRALKLEKEKQTKRLSGIIEGAGGGGAICELWRTQFSNLFNYPTPLSHHEAETPAAPTITTRNVERAIKGRLNPSVVLGMMGTLYYMSSMHIH